MANCPCQSGRDQADCCDPYINGDRLAQTAETLMRARYTAHTQANMDFIVNTHDPATRDQIDVNATLEWARESDWLGLDILRVNGGEADDAQAEIEFVAHFREEGQRKMHHELAHFGRSEDGQWMFIDGAAPELQPVRRATPKVGRNDPCPCGSGRKHKKCCA